MPEVLSHPSPAPESLPETPEVDAETVAEIDSIDQPNDQPGFREQANKFADRVNDILDKRLSQKDAYDSYAENISATKSREKAERRHERKENPGVLRKIGNYGLTFAAAQGFIPPRGEWHKQGKGTLNMNFTAWVARKYVAAQERQNARLAGFLSAEQNAAIMGGDNPLTGEAETPTVEIPPVPADTTEIPPEPSTPEVPPVPADTTPETTTSSTEAEPAEGEPHDEEYVERARREAEAAARSAEEQRSHEHNVV